MSHTPNQETRAAMAEADAIVAARRGDTLSFGAALFALKQGQRVRRQDWSSDFFAVLVGETLCTTTALPGWKPHAWLPSHGDLLADDWAVMP